MTDKIASEIRHTTGVITLCRPERLNALDSEMIEALDGILSDWRTRAEVRAVVLRSHSERAFCAGGDILQLHQGIVNGALEQSMLFFEKEYGLDRAIHRFPKPILCLAHGIVMGGGWGLMAGCSHRILSEKSVLAMPEITIGFYPDVGATYFLSRLHHKFGLFCALTACRLGPADALFLRAVEGMVPFEKFKELTQAVVEKDWEPLPDAAHAQMTQLIARFLADPGQSSVAPRLAHLHDLLESASPYTWDARARALAQTTVDPWIRQSLETYLQGSPTSAAVIYQQFSEGANLSVEEAFELELRLTRRFLSHPDLPEGIRALLIDKDRCPKWNPSSLQDVDRNRLQRDFL